MKAFIDNIPVAYPSASLSEPKFTLRRKNEDSETAVSFTGELLFTGTDYDYIYQKLVLDPQAINNSIELKFVDDCCGDKEYFFLIKPESLKWCDNSCEITANAVEYNAATRAYACLESTLIWDDFAGFWSKTHPKVKYCLEYRPSLLQDFVLIAGLFVIMGTNALIFTLVTTLGPLILTINGIISAINTLGGNLNPISLGGTSSFLGMIQYIFNLMGNIGGQLVSGCGFEHPAPLVRDYITNVCAKCGLGFSSSILDEPNTSKPNNDYFNLLYFSAPIKSGNNGVLYFGKPFVNYIDANKPIHNGKTFMDELKEPFNAGWDISNNVLRFERRDFFQVQTPWFNATVYDSSKIISQCFEWSSQRRPAYADIGYQRDALDWVGSEANPVWSELIGWNPANNPIQKGPFTKIFPYSTARFRKDGIDRDVLGDYDWMPAGIGTAIKANPNCMLMNSGTSWIPKLLIWNDSVSPIQAAEIISYNKAGYAYAYNYPMWVDTGGTGNLYDRFWYIENPSLASFSGFDFEIEVIWDCNLLNSIDLEAPVMTSRGLSKTIIAVDLNFETSTMIIRGTI